MNWNITSTNEKVVHVEKRVNLHARKLRMLAYMSIDIESRSRRNNMIFRGITENNNRPCETLILGFMADEMRIDTGAWSLIEPTDLVLYAEILVEQTQDDPLYAVSEITEMSIM